MEVQAKSKVILIILMSLLLFYYFGQNYKQLDCKEIPKNWGFPVCTKLSKITHIDEVL